MNQNTESLRVAYPIETQHATNAEISATETATQSATVTLKALAHAFLERNSAATIAQQAGCSTRTNTLPEDTTLLRSVALMPEDQPDALRWPQFIALCTAQDVTEGEVLARISERDISDLCDEPAQKLPLDARTIVDTIKRERPAVEPENSNLRTFDSSLIMRCKDCQHFKRIEHPHLGTCAAGEHEGIAGNWDTDPRNHCQSWKSC